MCKMHTRSNLHILYTILFIMIARAQCSELMCYICDDCAQITETTPKQACDESFFNSASTLPSTVTTESIENSPTTTMETTSSEKTISTSQLPPSPPTSTVGPPKTTPLTTPPSKGTVPTELTLLNNETTTTDEVSSEITTYPSTTSEETDETLPTTVLEPIKLEIQPAEIHMRRFRSIPNEEYTYHCYIVQQKINDTMTTSRGCSRVGPSEGVCSQLEANKINYSSCHPCSSSLCNSSSSFGVSMVAIMSGLIAALFLRSSA